MNHSIILKHLDYETRNLGVASYAVTEEIIGGLTKEMLNSTIDYQLEADKKLFIQVRITQNNWKCISTFEKCGFSFIETTLSGYTMFSRNSALREFLRDKSKFTPRRYDINKLNTCIADTSYCEVRSLIRTIANESFINDRFHLDPNCNIQTANDRFTNWVEDLFGDNNANFLLLSYDGLAIGFTVRKEDHIILAGFVRKYASSGLGDFLILDTFRTMIEDGITCARSQLSTNNIPSLNMQIRQGFKFRDPAAIFHYWNSHADGA